MKPGKSATLSFDIDAALLASFDEASTSWITEAGDYTIKVGASSKDIKEKATFAVANDIVVEKVSKAMVPQKDFEKMHR